MTINGKIMMKKILYFMLSIWLMALLLSTCTKSRPLGGDYEIRVLADSSIWNGTKKILSQTFEQVEYTPLPEKLFTLIKQEPNKYKKFKNILFLSTLDARDELSKSINSNLSEQARAKVEQGEIMFIKRNIWAQNQQIMFLIGADKADLANKISAQQDRILFQFEDYWRAFHKDILYSRREQKDVESHLLKNYGWMIRVPIDYRLEFQSARDRLVLFHRKMPLRWISIFWEEATDPNLITKKFCIQKRNFWSSSFFAGDSVDEKFEPVQTEEVNFLNRRALKLKGLWGNSRQVAGGPFRLYCFFDEPTERIYFIDMHMFQPNPKKSKMHYLRQMDIVAHTFKTNLEVTLNK